jgi:hypothetical protein
MGTDELDFESGEKALVDIVQARHISVALVLHQPPIVAVRRDTKTIFSSILQAASEFRGIPHDFFWNAADIDASTAQPARLDEYDSGAMLGGALGGSQAAATAADHDQIELVSHIPFVAPLPRLSASSGDLSELDNVVGLFLEAAAAQLARGCMVTHQV